jgi:hypothetical protein
MTWKLFYKHLPTFTELAFFDVSTLLLFLNSSFLLFQWNFSLHAFLFIFGECARQFGFCGM